MQWINLLDAKPDPEEVVLWYSMISKRFWVEETPKEKCYATDTIEPIQWRFMRGSVRYDPTGDSNWRNEGPTHWAKITLPEESKVEIWPTVNQFNERKVDKG